MKSKADSHENFVSRQVVTAITQLISAHTSSSSAKWESGMKGPQMEWSLSLTIYLFWEQVFVSSCSQTGFSRAGGNFFLLPTQTEHEFGCIPAPHLVHSYHVTLLEFSHPTQQSTSDKWVNSWSSKVFFNSNGPPVRSILDVIAYRVTKKWWTGNQNKFYVYIYLQSHDISYHYYTNSILVISQ